MDEPDWEDAFEAGLADDMAALHELEAEQEKALRAGQSDILTAPPLNASTRRVPLMFEEEDDDDAAGVDEPATVNPPPASDQFSSSPSHVTSPSLRPKPSPRRIEYTSIRLPQLTPISHPASETQSTAFSLADSSDEEDDLRAQRVARKQIGTSADGKGDKRSPEVPAKRGADDILPEDQARSKKFAVDAVDWSTSERVQPVTPTHRAIPSLIPSLSSAKYPLPDAADGQSTLLFDRQMDGPSLFPAGDADNGSLSNPMESFITSAPKRRRTGANLPDVGTSKSFRLDSQFSEHNLSNPHKPAPDFQKLSRNFTVRPLDTYNIITGCSSSGKRLYFPKKNLTTIGGGKSIISSSIENKRGTLLGKSIYQMMDEVDAERKAAAQEEATRAMLVEEYGKAGEVLNLDPDAGDEDLGKGEEGKVNQLWVDKYRPTMYMDLVGDERINRELLNWVKAWDHCVFKKAKRKDDGKGKSKPGWQKDGWQKEKGNFNQHYKDPYDRPEKKILLLSGPPGLGKTTLAHVAAHHAGYNVVEINASDDRTGDALKNKLMGALESQSVMGNKRPSLVVIDEIDGASAGGSGDNNFMKMLLDVVNGDSKARVLKHKGQSKKTEGKPLLRPVICICNDFYAPVLRPLRHLAQTYTFREPSLQLVARRLHEICRWEGLKADNRALTALCESTEGDIRSCLNTLQFFKNRGKEVTLHNVGAADVGHKDVKKGLFQVLEGLFVVPEERARRKMAAGGSGGDAEKYIPRLLDLVTSNGEYEKLMQGCFETYLRTKIFDTVLSSGKTKIVRACDWMGFWDKLESGVWKRGHHELQAYFAWPVLSFYGLFASARRVKVEFPRVEHEVTTQTMANRNILINLASGMPPILRRNWANAEQLMVELAPYLLRILSPELRPVNIQLVKPAERVVLDRLVEIMCTFGVRFVQEKSEEGQYVYRLDPPIDVLVSGLGNSFSTGTMSSRRVLNAPYAVRQLIAQEIDKELIRRAEAAANARNPVREKEKGLEGKSENEDDGVFVAPAPVQKRAVLSKPVVALTPKVVEEEKPALDFFGRPIVVKDEGDGDATSGGKKALKSAGARAQASVGIRRVVFKFNEGFSNAVRKPVYVRDLL
ncbi:hypothetical protein HDV00_001563 [Rhizophlyctis rosea]|nr:hypothetical protein HDV00_001563 [Rhizophlyctis rosea]